MSLSKEKKICVFFDFDHTVVDLDVLSSVVRRFGEKKEWLKYENAWLRGKISARECLRGQAASIRADRKTLKKHLCAIRVPAAFKRTVSLLRDKKIPVMIVSDGFELFIRTILKANGLPRIPIYANGLRFKRRKIFAGFPYASASCSRCANCKKQHVIKHKDKFRIYVGDGVSDYCGAAHADLVFAKGRLEKYLRKKGKPYRKWKDLNTVFAGIKRIVRHSKRGKSPLTLSGS